jgi:hypothetical protein
MQIGEGYAAVQKTGFFTKLIFSSYKVSAWLFNHVVCKIGVCRWFRFAQLAKGKKSRP